ncbi:MAG: Coenzyme F420 hydrogenase/dehydrogenase, beta subunit C-terminal domain [Deltaproteobacteria bacterium]|nr:Coenzyme F420 hydrogenase/dehydrogenase, beta subunit C-terminal domain [Deltaproteobacteria bacterium]
MEEQQGNRGQKGLKELVLDRGLCVGCGACVNLCPYQCIYRDNTILLHSCDLDGGRCYAYCPRTPTDLEALRKSLFDPKDLTPEIGAIKAFYITRAADPRIREDAQHGGTVTALVRFALKEGIIDTAVLAEDTGAFLPSAIAVTDPVESTKGLKSKFVVSPSLATFNSIAKEDVEKIGVVATPCQALALAKMRMDPIKEKDNTIGKLKLVIGLFCGWALSWRELVSVLRSKTSLDAISGMDIPPSMHHILQVYTKDGTIDISLDEILSCVRESCSYCLDMTAEFSDISVGSARLQEGWDEAKGWNQVIVRTETGVDLIARARAQGILEFHDIPETNLDKLKKASTKKKMSAIENLMARSGSPEDLLYLNSHDPMLKTLIG